MTQTGPRGWHAGLIETRFTSTAQLSYDAESRTVDAVISRGSPVTRFYGTEILRISPDAVIIDRLISGGIPLLDSHNQGGIGNSLGRVQRVWFSGGALMGKLAFNGTTEGRKAEGMVKRGEISGISAGYRVDEWEVSDGDGNVIDPETSQWRWDESDRLTYTATRWELLEASLVLVPADASASIRSLGGDRSDLTDIRGRMLSRQRMATRQSMHDAQQAAMLGVRDD
jgi:hypothetical protein